MLDVSAAFDVVDHKRLLERHHQYFGLSDTALKWMSSYLEGRKQTVSISSAHSKTTEATSGFPQGSVLGGKKFTMYATPVGNVIDSHNIKYKYYADDGQKYISFNLKNPDEVKQAIHDLELSLNDVYSWMTANMLKMNNDKTEVILFAPKRLLSNVSPSLSLTVHQSNISPKLSVRNLGVMLDATLSMQLQINMITKGCYYQLRKISRIRKYLTMSAAKTLVTTLVLSKIDYCNSLLVNLPAYLLKKLQKVQNYAARVVKKLKIRVSITKHLKGLHWLPVDYRIKFKIALLTFKSLNKLAPNYLASTIQMYQPVRSLRSASRNLLVKKRFSSRYGRRAFSTAAPEIWNDLPENVKNSETLSEFKTNLKTYFFTQAFPSN